MPSCSNCGHTVAYDALSCRSCGKQKPADNGWGSVDRAGADHLGLSFAVTSFELRSWAIQRRAVRTFDRRSIFLDIFDDCVVSCRIWRLEKKSKVTINYSRHLVKKAEMGGDED